MKVLIGKLCFPIIFYIVIVPRLFTIVKDIPYKTHIHRRL